MFRKSKKLIAALLSVTVLLSCISCLFIFASANSGYTVTLDKCYDSGVSAKYNALVTSYGENRLIGTDVYGKTSAYNETVIVKSEWAKLTDGDPNGQSSNVNISANYFPTLYFELDSYIEVSQFTIFNYISWGTNLEICDFDVFMSADVGTLWDASNQVIDYVASSNTATMANNIIKFEFSSDSRPIAKYIGVRWNDPYNFRSGSSGVVLSEIAAFGEEVDYSAPVVEHTYKTLLQSLSGGLLSYETGLNDLRYGKMVSDTSGADYVGGMNQTTYNSFRNLSGTNLLEGITPEIGTTAGNKIIYKDGNYTHRAADNIINSASCYQFSVTNSNDERINVADSPITLTYDLGKTVMAENIMIASSRGNNQLVAYELYISDDKQTLYSDENKFAAYDVANSLAVNKWKDRIEDTATWANKPSSEASPYLAQIYIPDSAIGRYFGIKIIRTITNTSLINANTDQVAIGELAFFARPFIVNDDVISAKDAKVLYDAENLLRTAKAYKDGLTLDAAQLIDGDYATEVYSAPAEGTVYFEMDDFYMIEKLAVMSSAAGWGEGNARLGEYEVYTSLDIDELFDEKNKQAYFSATQGTTLSNGVTVDEIVFNESIKARYIGIKITKPSLLAENDGIRLYEIAAMGESMPAYTVDTRVMLKTNAVSYVNDNFGVNRLLNGTIEASNVYKGFGYNQAYLFDDDLTEFYFERDGGDPKITFTMRNEILVSDFAIFSAANPYGLGGIRLGEYELYISENKDELYNTENLAAHVTPDRHSTMDNGTVVDLISLKDTKKARYFGIIIKDDNLSDSYVGIRVQEFAVYGSPLSASKDKMTALLDSLGKGLLDTTGKNDLELGKVVATPEDQVAYNGGINKPTYDAINELYYNKNLLSGKVAEVSVDDGYTFYSPDGVAERLTDGVISSSSTWSLQVKKDDAVVTFNDSNILLTYDLGKKSSLELMTVAGYRADNYQQQKYKIYVSDDKETLYNAENLVTVYDIAKNALANGKPLPTDPYAKNADSVTNDKPLIAQYIDMSGISGRYVGIRILGSKDRVALGEIALWASKDVYLPQLDTYGLYSEEIFNIIENGDLEAELAAEDWGELTDGFERVNNKSDNATHGEYYLVSSDETSQTWMFTVKPETEYTVALSAKLSSSADTKLAVAYNAEGNEFEDVIPGSVSGKVEKGVLTLSDTNGQWKRFGYSFYSAEHTTVYITVSNTAGKAALDDFYLFRSDRGYSADPNDYTITPTGYIGGVEIVDAQTGLSSNATEIPQTGDNSKMPVVLAVFIASLILTGVFAVMKGGKKNEYK